MGVEAAAQGAVLLTTDKFDVNRRATSMRALTPRTLAARTAEFVHLQLPPPNAQLGYDIDDEALRGALAAQIAATLLRLFEDRELLHGLSVRGQRRFCEVYSFACQNAQLFAAINAQFEEEKEERDDEAEKR